MKKIVVFALVVLVFCFLNTYAQMGGGDGSGEQTDNKKLDDDAKKALAEFQKLYKEAKDKEERKVKALDVIRGINHKIIIDELSKLLRNEKSKKVKMEIINIMGMFKSVDCVKPLEDTLKKDVKEPEIRDMVIQSLGIIAHCHCIKPLKNWIEKNISSIESSDLANTTGKAISALGNIRDKESIEVLIKNYEKAETIVVDEKDTEKKNSKEYLLNSFKNTLQMLTGLDPIYLPENAKEWKKWWNKEKTKFKFSGEQ